ncbi:hypothetical protein GUJ93_ZPchr0012g21290 [Zizania palustris]|uniref:Uncharacterized protein n=1 Tax=Zizania palustris TaxID=103762 RepID=A0A8J6BST3_ZIZPA|nr:hypothetical protein GUJ93_ZPchr0012g21290 [Zizania palustris]
MALAPTSLRCFLTGRPLCRGSAAAVLTKPTRRPSARLSCRVADEEGAAPSTRAGFAVKLGELAMVALATGVLAFGPVDDAMAAKSGGRIGGQAFRSAPRSAPRASGPRINNSRTNIYINPPLAPPLVGGYGYGYSYGGWGWSPFSFFAPGPSVAVGVGGGFDVLVVFIVFGAVVGTVRRFLNRDDDDYDDY